MIKAMSLNLAIPIDVVKSDRQNIDIMDLNEEEFMRIASGKITISIDDDAWQIVLETEVLDYVIQLKEVVDRIDSGQDRSFAVSRDYYSNNLYFELSRKTNQLTIYEMNGGSFQFTLPYRQFRRSILDFHSRAMAILQKLYPELAKNKAFLNCLKS